MIARSMSLALLAATLTSAAALAASLSVKGEMKTVVDPQSTLLFAVGGEVDPANGPDAAKTPAARWTSAGEAAAKLQAVALALQQPGRAKDNGAWMGFAKQMATTSAAAATAVRTHNGAALAQAANDLSDTCSACHAKYRPNT